ncbi:MAG TPA: sugar phosphate isomerase/epimerase [Acidimicrobiia bacterium]
MSGVTDETGWVLWAATVGLESSIGARVEAAHAARCSRLSLAAGDVASLEAEGTPAAELGRLLRGEGLEVVMDPVTGWYGGAPMPGRFGEVGFDDELRMAEELGVVSMTAIGPFTPGEVPVDDLPDRFGAFCDRAADFGAQVQYEFMPVSAMADVTSVWDVVRAAGRRNGGIMFDTLHFFRSGGDFAALAQVPGDRILAVQVSDAPADVQGSLGEDTFHRRLPGDGDLDLAGALAAIDRVGALRWVGAEVLSPETAAMPPAEAGRVATDRVRALVARVQSGRAADE